MKENFYYNYEICEGHIKVIINIYLTLQNMHNNDGDYKKFYYIDEIYNRMCPILFKPNPPTKEQLLAILRKMSTWFLLTHNLGLGKQNDSYYFRVIKHEWELEPNAFVLY